jgi:hypothetical protein
MLMSTGIFAVAMLGRRAIFLNIERLSKLIRI